MLRRRGLLCRWRRRPGHLLLLLRLPGPNHFCLPLLLLCQLLLAHQLGGLPLLLLHLLLTHFSLPLLLHLLLTHFSLPLLLHLLLTHFSLLLL
jgi:hypothetical protein